MLNPVAVAFAPAVLLLGAGEAERQIALPAAPVLELAQAKVKDKTPTAADIEAIDEEIEAIDEEIRAINAEICQLSIELAELDCPGWFCVERGDEYIYASRDGRWWFEADGRVIPQSEWPEEAMCLDAWNAR